MFEFEVYKRLAVELVMEKLLIQAYLIGIRVLSA